MNTETTESSRPVAGQVERPVRPLGAEVLHCYAQHSWHSEAYIGGGRDALVALRNAIDAALADGTAECRVVCNDGECYSVYVVAMSNENAERQVVPYTADYAAQSWAGDAYGPWCELQPDAKCFAA